MTILIIKKNMFCQNIQNYSNNSVQETTKYVGNYQNNGHWFWIEEIFQSKKTNKSYLQKNMLNSLVPENTTTFTRHRYINLGDKYTCVLSFFVVFIYLFFTSSYCLLFLFFFCCISASVIWGNISQAHFRLCLFVDTVMGLGELSWKLGNSNSFWQRFKHVIQWENNTFILYSDYT